MRALKCALLRHRGHDHASVAPCLSFSLPSDPAPGVPSPLLVRVTPARSLSESLAPIALQLRFLSSLSSRPRRRRQASALDMPARLTWPVHGMRRGGVRVNRLRQEPCAVAIVTLDDDDVHAAHETRAEQVPAAPGRGRQPETAADLRRNERAAFDLDSAVLRGDCARV